MESYVKLFFILLFLVAPLTSFEHSLPNDNTLKYIESQKNKYKYTVHLDTIYIYPPFEPQTKDEIFVSKFLSSKEQIKQQGLTFELAVCQAFVEQGYNGVMRKRRTGGYRIFNTLCRSHYKWDNIHKCFGPDAVEDEGTKFYCTYSNPGKCIEGWISFLKKYKRYKPVFNTDKPEEQIDAIVNAKYATAKNYKSKLLWALKRFRPIFKRLE